MRRRALTKFSTTRCTVVATLLSLMMIVSFQLVRRNFDIPEFLTGLQILLPRRSNRFIQRTVDDGNFIVRRITEHTAATGKLPNEEELRTLVDDPRLGSQSNASLSGVMTSQSSTTWNYNLDSYDGSTDPKYGFSLQMQITLGSGLLYTSTSKRSGWSIHDLDMDTRKPLPPLKSR